MMTAANSKKSNKKPSNTVRKPLTLRRRVAYILIGTAIVGVLLSVILFLCDNKPATASAQMQLTFDGAAEGIAPDGRRFDIGEITSEEVIEEALKEAGLDGKYTAEQISKSLVVAGTYPEDIVGQSMSYESLLDFTTNRTLTTERFNPTLFTVKLYNHFDEKISKEDQEKLLTSILTVYKVRFAKMYTQGLPTKNSAFPLAGYDYPQQLEILEQRLEIIGNYANEMYEKEPTFRFENAGFNDIVVRLKALTDSDIGRLNANLTLNALTKDPDRLLTQYNFELRDLGNRLAKRRGQLTKLDTLVSSYEKSEILYISTKDSLTKIDGNSTETYDSLVDIRRAVAEDNTKISSQIATYQLKLSDLVGEPANTGDDKTSADGQNGENTENASESGETQSGESADGDAAGSSDQQGETGDGDGSGTKTQTLKVDNATTKAQREALEKEIAALEEKSNVVIADFAKMLEAWNAQKVNDSTVTVSNYRYSSQKLISGAFIKRTVMTAGPIIALAVIVSLCMIIVTKSREMKAEA